MLQGVENNLYITNPSLLNRNSIEQDNTIDFSSYATNSINTANNFSYDEYYINSLSDEEKQAVIFELENQLTELKEDFEVQKNSKGWISGLWDGFKNLTGIGAGSNKTQNEINNLENTIEKLKQDDTNFYETLNSISDEDITLDTINSFLNHEENFSLSDITKAGKSLDNYKEGQKMCVDIAGDMVSAIVAVGASALVTAALAISAPISIPALLAAGVAGALVKTAIKASDCIGNEKQYTKQNLAYDMITGSVNGVMAPLSNALGGMAGTGIMKAAGMEALETTVVKSATLSGGRATIEQAAKLTGKQIAIKTGAKLVTKTIDGGLSGATDAFIRDIATGDTDNILEDTAQGFLGGAAGGIVIGTGFEQMGKLGKAIGSTDTMQKIASKISSVTDNITPIRVIRNATATLATSTALKNCLSIDGDIYNINLGQYTVKVSEGELSEEILQGIINKDNTLIYKYAQGILQEALSQGAIKEISENAGKNIAKKYILDSETKDKLQEFLGENFDINKSLSQLSEQQYKNLLLCMENLDNFDDIKPNDLIRAIKELNDRQMSVAIEYFKDCDTSATKFISIIKSMNDSAIDEFYVQYSDFDDAVAAIIGVYNKNFAKGFNVGFTFGEMASLSDTQMNLAVKYLELGEDAFDAECFALYEIDDIKYAQYKNFIEQGVQKDEALSRAILGEEKFSSLSKNYTIDEPKSAFSVSHFTQDEMRALDELYRAGLDFDKAVEITDKGISQDMLDNILYSLDSLKGGCIDDKSSVYAKRSVDIINCDDGYEIKISRSADNTSVSHIINSNGDIYYEREEIQNGIVTSWTKGGSSEFITEYNTMQNIFENNIPIGIKSQTEVIKDEFGEPVKIVHKKLSENLEGVYERTEYILKDYPQDFDILQAINNGTIEGGNKLSYTVLNSDGSVSYFENLSQNGNKIERIYTKNNSSSDYKYRITSQDGNILADVNRSFEFSDNSSTTIINGKKYTAYFDDEAQKITISYDGIEHEIDIMAKTQGDLRLWEVCKNSPADILLTLDKNVDNWVFSKDLMSQFDACGILSSGDSSSIVFHELGHSIDFESTNEMPLSFQAFNKDSTNLLSNNPTLKEIYDKELEIFNKRYTQSSAKAYTSYFSKENIKPLFGNARGVNGLTELFAETNMLLMTYGHSDVFTSTRAQLLAENFPQTIAYISKILLGN